jgi:hypothetical protein
MVLYVYMSGDLVVVVVLDVLYCIVIVTLDKKLCLAIEQCLHLS